MSTKESPGRRTTTRKRLKLCLLCKEVAHVPSLINKNAWPKLFERISLTINIGMIVL
jgi:hypothetical protein